MSSADNGSVGEEPSLLGLLHRLVPKQRGVLPTRFGGSFAEKSRLGVGNTMGRKTRIHLIADRGKIFLRERTGNRRAVGELIRPRRPADIQMAQQLFRGDGLELTRSRSYRPRNARAPFRLSRRASPD